MLFRKRINYVAPMLASAAILLLLLSGYFELPSISSLSTPAPLLPGAGATRFPTALDSVGSRDRDPFTSLLEAFNAWDAAVGCPRIRAKLAAAELLAANATAEASASATAGTARTHLPGSAHECVGAAASMTAAASLRGGNNRRSGGVGQEQLRRVGACTRAGSSSSLRQAGERLRAWLADRSGRGLDRAWGGKRRSTAGTLVVGIPAAGRGAGAGKHAT